MVDKPFNTVHSTPTSYHSAELSEIVLSETPRTRTVFMPIHVDNPHDRSKQLKGSLVFQKPKQADTGIRLTRRDIRAGEYVELALDTSETYNLAKELSNYYKITANRMTAVRDVEYVRQIPNDAIIKALKTRPELIDLLSQSDVDLFEMAMRLRELRIVRDTIQQNLENGNEQFWQELFQTHPWVISQVFALPYMLYVNQPYVGGKSISGKHGKFPDFLYKNKVTGNVAIIELKTPITSLVNENAYRDGVYSIHRDVSGAVAQVLTQRDTLYKEYSVLMLNEEDNERYETLNFESILIVGNTGALNTKGKRHSFELYRNELRNITIVGYDELLEKLNIMIDLMTAESQ